VRLFVVMRVTGYDRARRGLSALAFTLSNDYRARLDRANLLDREGQAETAHSKYSAVYRTYTGFGSCQWTACPDGSKKQRGSFPVSVTRQFAVGRSKGRAKAASKRRRTGVRRRAVKTGLFARSN